MPVVVRHPWDMQGEHIPADRLVAVHMQVAAPRTGKGAHIQVGDSCLMDMQQDNLEEADYIQGKEADSF